MGDIRVLVIDDDPLMREFLAEALRRGGYAVDVETSGAGGVERFARERHDIVITDLKMPGMDGLTVLRRVRELDAEAQVILMTAYGTIDSAVAALREGASDYLLKPFRPDALAVAVSRARERARLLRENAFLSRELNAGFEEDGMVGNSPAMREVYEMIRRVASVYDDDVQLALMDLASMLEPIILLVMGVVVGFIVLASALPTASLLQTL